MKITKIAKLSGLLALVIGMTVGCATAPTEAPAPEAAVEQDTAKAKAAIDAAKAAIARTDAEGYLWRDTEKTLKQAEKALKAGDAAKAIMLAEQAKGEAELALDQKRREQTRIQRMFADEAAAAAAAKPAKADQYGVVRGDSLWRISGKGEIYGNPYEWPLIYKANKDKIKDADLIYPGQKLAIERGASDADVAAAVRHAKTRGAWALGVVEESDKAYLAR